MEALERLETVSSCQCGPALASARGKLKIFPHQNLRPVLAISFRLKKLKQKTPLMDANSSYLYTLPQVTSVMDAAEFSNHSFRVWYL